MKKLLLILSTVFIANICNATGYYWIPPVGTWILIGNVMDGEPNSYVAGSNYSAMVRIYTEARNKQPY